MNLRKTAPDYVSPRTLRRRKGRAIRKARRLARARYGTLTVSIRAVAPAFLGLAVAMSGIGSAISLAQSRIRALEEDAARAAALAATTPLCVVEDAAAMFRADVMAQSLTHEGVER